MNRIDWKNNGNHQKSDGKIMFSINEFPEADDQKLNELIFKILLPTPAPIPQPIK